VNLVVTLEKTHSILSLDALPKDQIKKWTVGSVKTPGGVLIVVGVVVILVIGIAGLWSIYKKKSKKNMDEVTASLKKLVFWNPIIRAYLIACL
jgi:hypothetical protein